MTSYKDIEKKADALLSKLDVMKPPIDLTYVAEQLNIKVEMENLDDDVSGFFLRKSKMNIIGLNKDHPPVRRRFTLAHEIGHCILHSEQPLFIDNYKGVMFRNQESSTGEEVKEREANFFAASLLMPRKLIKEAISEISDETIFDKKVKSLSKTFKVSTDAMRYRLHNLGFYDYGF